jgi:hypothetical protein
MRRRRLRVVRAESLIRVGTGPPSAVMGLDVETPVTLAASSEPVAPPDAVDLPAALHGAIQGRPLPDVPIVTSRVLHRRTMPGWEGCGYAGGRTPIIRLLGPGSRTRLTAVNPAAVSHCENSGSL